MKRILLIILFLNFFFLQIFAQNSDMVFQEKGVSLDFNKGNGGVGTSVHLFDLDFGDRNIPITVNYSSSGLRYDDVYGKLGAGWNFSLDYALNRTIRGKQDEYSILPNMDSVETLMGAISNLNKYQKDQLLLNFAVKSHSISIGLGNINEFPKWSSTTIKNWDSEYDIFSFSNFSGGGKFVLLNRGREILDSRSLQFFETPSVKWKVENDFHPLVPFYIADDSGVKYEYASLGSTSINGNGAITSQRLNTAIHPRGDSIIMEYDNVQGNIPSTERFLSVLEGGDDAVNNFRIQSRIDEITPSNNTDYQQLLSVVFTKKLKINISYFMLNNNRLISSIVVSTRQQTPRVIRNISFQYVGLGTRFALLKKIEINNGSPAQSGNINKSYDFAYFSENSTHIFDRDLFGYVNSSQNGNNSNATSFPLQVNQLLVYAGDFTNFSSPWLSGNLNQLKSNLKVSDKLMPNENKIGLLNTITESSSNLITHFDYDLNSFRNSVGNQVYYAGYRLKETYQKINDTNDKINHRRFYYGDILIEHTYNSNGSSGPEGNGWIFNNYFSTKNVENNYIRQKGLAVKIPTSSGSDWRLLNKYEIASNYTSESSFLDLFSNNVYFKRVLEVTFNSGQPITMKESKYVDDFSSQDAIELNLRNNQMNLLGRGLKPRQYKPDYLPIVYAGKKPLLSQENDYEFINGSWRIRTKTTFQYNLTDAAGIYMGDKKQLRQLMIRDFARLNQTMTGNDGDMVNLYNKLGIDSFFDYNFYTIDLNSKILTSKQSVDYRYDN